MQGGVREAGRDKVHDNGEPVVQHGDGEERGRRGGRGEADGEGDQAGEVDAAAAQLGPALEDGGQPHRRVAHLPGHDRRPPQGHLLARPPPRLAVRRHLPGYQELQLILINHANPTAKYEGSLTCMNADYCKSGSNR